MKIYEKVLVIKVLVIALGISIGYFGMSFLMETSEPEQQHTIYNLPESSEYDRLRCYFGMDYGPSPDFCFYVTESGEVTDKRYGGEHGLFWKLELVGGLKCSEIGSCSFGQDSCLNPSCDEYSRYEDGEWKVEYE